MGTEIMEEDLRNFEFLAINSKEIIEKQVDSYRQQHSYAGTIIGFTVLFIPFFLNSLEGSRTRATTKAEKRYFIGASAGVFQPKNMYPFHFAF